MAILDFFRPKEPPSKPLPVATWCVVTPELLDYAKTATAHRVLSSDSFVVIRPIGGWSWLAYTEDGDPHFTAEQAGELAAKLGAMAAPRALAYNKILTAKE
jgi:hypothetical protein